MKKIYLLLLGIIPTISFAQNLTDGLMMPKKSFCTGLMYTHDQWKEYWEGELKRENGNIGKVTTQSLMWVGTYGVIDKLNVIAMVPYMKVKPSAGTLHDMEGLQDLTVGVKYNFLRYKTEKTTLRSFGVVSVSTPLSDYTPDFYPMSLGSHTTNIQYRLTSHFRVGEGFLTGLFVNASAGYTWRSNTTLDRPSYYDGNDLVLSDEVKMPNVFDVFVAAGYHNGPVQAELQYLQMNTLGGADIRRQDMPFVSNRMNAQKVGALVMYYLPVPKGTAVRGMYNYTVAGRNVGQSTTLMAGVLYTIQFSHNE